MWYLLMVFYFTLILGNIHGNFQNQNFVNPEANMNISQIISYWGYPDEEYDVVTEDGYILGLYRIPYGKTNLKGNPAPRLVVYLQHGLLMSASAWISNLPNNSLGFLLADAGYDVWMGNSRGNTWSRKHVYLETNSSEFWAFSFDEMAKYDLPASLDFIVKHTGQEKLFYIGHSQGTTIAFIAFSTMPKIAKRIKILFALAPVASIKHTKCPLIKMAYKLKRVIKVFAGNKDFLPTTSFNNFVGPKMCSLLMLNKICLNSLFMLFGKDTKNINMVGGSLAFAPKYGTVSKYGREQKLCVMELDKRVWTSWDLGVDRDLSKRTSIPDVLRCVFSALLEASVILAHDHELIPIF